MSWLSLLIALFQVRNSSLVGNARWFDYLTHVVGVEKFFFTFSWIIFGVAIVVVIVLAILSRGEFFNGLGCMAIMILVWLGTLPLFEWITLSLAKGALANFDPVVGIVNQGSFFINAGLYLLLGGG